MLGIAGLIAGLQFVEEPRAGRDSSARNGIDRAGYGSDLSKSTASGFSATAIWLARVGTLSFKRSRWPAELGGILDQSFDIAVRPGLHCAPYIHRSLGTFPDGLVRASVGPFNTADDVDHLANAVKEILELSCSICGGTARMLQIQPTLIGADW